MSRSTTKATEKTIEAVLGEFLQEQRERLKPSTMRKYEDIIELFQLCLNNYAYQYLNKRQSALFDRLYNVEGDGHREFCQIFGPQEIPHNVSEFLNYFMIRKVMCGKELKQAAGTVIKKLGRWLEAQGYIESENAAEVASRGATAAKELPAMEELAGMLGDYADSAAVRCDEVIEDHFRIETVEPDKLHLTTFQADDKIIIPVPRNISAACRAGWSISGAVGKNGRDWRILELWNVYPY